MNFCICHTSQFIFILVFLAYSNNRNYLRMRALYELSTEKYRRDVISGNVADYIMEGVYRNTNLFICRPDSILRIHQGTKFIRRSFR
jgi:hypothetical protein